MNTKHWSEHLRSVGPMRLRACEEAITWAWGFPTPAEAWGACARGDWLIWVALALAGPWGSKFHRAVVLAAARCAATVPPDAARPGEAERGG